MIDNKENERLIFLLKEDLKGGLSEEEQAEVEAWADNSASNRALLERVRHRKSLGEKLDFYLSTDSRRDWEEIQRKTHLGVRSAIRWYRWAYAAVVTGILILSAYLYIAQQPMSGQMLAQAEMPADSIQPGSQRAYIELASGEILRLGDTLNRVDKKLEGAELKEVAGGVLLVASDTLPAVETQVAYNRLSVPRGGEYRLNLPDGSRVWVNSDSRLEFPTAFSGDKRLVRLSGEAYFEVKHNENMPFQVEANGVKIRVLGTSFNIYAYEQRVNTTLVQGKVEVDVAENTYRLSPGEQAAVEQGQVKVTKVDVEEQTGWKDGKFIFREKRLEDVMNILARWYDLEVFYRNNAVKDLHFTGNIPRHTSIPEVLKFLERTHLMHFTINGHTIIVGT